MSTRRDFIDYIDENYRYRYSLSKYEIINLCDYFIGYLKLDSPSEIKEVVLDDKQFINTIYKAGRYKEYKNIQSLIDEFGPFKTSVQL